MNLVETAETAQDVASGFHKFLIPVEESSSEITRLISECFAISSILRNIAATIRDPQYSQDYSNISDHLRVVVCSIEYTFDDVRRFCGRIVRTSSSAYRDVWKCIETYFLEESRNSLPERLAIYKIFLEDLQMILEDGLARLTQASVTISDESAGNQRIGMNTKLINFESKLS